MWVRYVVESENRCMSVSVEGKAVPENLNVLSSHLVAMFEAFTAITDSFFWDIVWIQH
jgi:hypothetical protein